MNFRRLILVVSGLLAVLLLPLSSQAIPEGELPAVYDGQVKPYFAQFTLGVFPGRGGVTLRYAKRENANARATLVVVSGRTEFLAKYAELCYDLRDLPVSWYLLDHRGQGSSERLLSEHDKGYVVNFQDYADDLSTFIDTVVGQGRQRPLVILAHSMGGLVSTLYANSHPQEVQGLILCAPMLGLHTAPLPNVVARLLARSATSLGFGDSYVPGGKAYNPAKPFATNDVTHSAARFALNKGLVAAAPANALGSATFAWVNQSFAGMDRLRTAHQGLTMPILLLQAAEDTVVEAEAQETLCGDLPHCTLRRMAKARHEILMEVDPVRDQALTLIRDFVNRLLPATSGGERP